MNFDSFQMFGKDGVEALMRSATALSNGAQTASVEMVEYAKRTLEQGSQAAEKLMGVRTLDAAVEVQGTFARSAYEGFVAQATRLGELSANTAKAAYGPIESLVAKPFAA